MSALEGEGGPANEPFLSLVIKTKLVQNVDRMSESQKHRPKDRQTDRQTDRRTDRKADRRR